MWNKELNMVYTQKYASPVGGMLLAADEIGLTGVWFDGEKFFADNLSPRRSSRSFSAAAARSPLGTESTASRPRRMRCTWIRRRTTRKSS